ncbi:MAG TPA: S8 family serine peptidase [Verrucomicrobiae bacterium]|nr:S8 family serine peptidase [Verrucomicrobiae bacterium]
MHNWVRHGLLCGLIFAAISLSAADTLIWQTNLVNADIQSLPLEKVLKQIARDSGWQVFLEPGTTRDVSTKFKDLPPGRALALLLGNLNFALVPQTNGPSRLLVFRTSRGNATEQVKPAVPRIAKHVPNELIVTLKPGMDIDALAKALGAKVTGHLDGINAYRLQFKDAAAAEAARQLLNDNPDVAKVDYNYVVRPPPSVTNGTGGGVPNFSLNMAPPGSNGRVIVGLVDTAVQPLSGDLNNFLLKQISVAGDVTIDTSSPMHGTAMAETMLRAISQATGGNSSVQILPVDVYGPNPNTTTFDVATGIVAAINHGANPINLSLGGTGNSQFLQELITQAVQNGITFFAAAGNDGSSEMFYPAAYTGVNAVTAASSPNQVASYANRGSFVDLMAPGSSMVYLNNSAYAVNGTSVSSAYISGFTSGLADMNKTSVRNATSTVLNAPAFRPPPMY